MKICLQAGSVVALFFLVGSPWARPLAALSPEGDAQKQIRSFYTQFDRLFATRQFEKLAKLVDTTTDKSFRTLDGKDEQFKKDLLQSIRALPDQLKSGSKRTTKIIEIKYKAGTLDQAATAISPSAHVKFERDDNVTLVNGQSQKAHVVGESDWVGTKAGWRMTETTITSREDR